MPEEGRQVILDSTNALNKYLSSSDVVAKVLPVELFQFDERSKKCYADVQTMSRLYGYTIFTKGCTIVDVNEINRTCYVPKIGLDNFETFVIKMH